MKNVLITGAGRGIGLALTKEFTAHGYHVIGTYRNQDTPLLKLENVTAVKADVTDESTFAMLKEQLAKLPQLDILINNSGVIGDKSSSLLEQDINKINKVLNVNTLGPMRICKLAIPFMKNSGIIAQISSQMGSIADSSGGYFDYRMSKAALNMFNRCLAKEFTKITCLTLHPGWVQTDMGGAGASVTTKDSASGLFTVITAATSEKSGKFFNYKGQELPW